MGVQEDIRRMKTDGKTEKEIIDILRRQRIPDNVISEGLAQVQIKEAVSAPGTPEDEFGMPPSLDNSERQDSTQLQGTQGVVQGSTKEFQNDNAEYSPPQLYSGNAGGLALPPEEEAQQQYAPQYGQEQSPQQDSSAGYSGNYPTEAYSADAYAQYHPYQEAMSSDMITEISEQVVSEKLAAIQDSLEKAINFRTVADARISGLNERLKRIEKIIDRLQLSLLEKVGVYVNEVEDLKTELEETQKSFKAIASGKRHHGPHAQTHQHKHPEHPHPAHSQEHHHEHHPGEHEHKHHP